MQSTDELDAFNKPASSASIASFASYHTHLCVRSQNHKPHTWLKFFDEVTGLRRFRAKRTLTGFLICDASERPVAKLRYNFKRTRYRLVRMRTTIAEITYDYKTIDDNEYFHSISLNLISRNPKVVLANENPHFVADCDSLKVSGEVDFARDDYVSSKKNFKLQSLSGKPTLEFGKVSPTHYRVEYGDDISDLAAVALVITRFFV
jgi:hypothetical protein